MGSTSSAAIRRGALALVAAVAGLSPTAVPARALDGPKFSALVPQVTVEEAFADSYGVAIVKELGAVLQQSADRACLDGKGLTQEKLATVGRSLLVTFGQRALDRARSFVDGGAADAHFARDTGGTGLSELQSLANAPIVKELQALDRPGHRDSIVDMTTETFDRYVLLKNIRLVRNVSPLATVSDLLNVSRVSKSEEDVEEFLDRNDSPVLARYIELLEAAEAAMAAAVDQQQQLHFGPLQAFEGLEGELRAICIVSHAN